MIKRMIYGILGSRYAFITSFFFHNCLQMMLKHFTLIFYGACNYHTRYRKASLIRASEVEISVSCDVLYWWVITRLLGSNHRSFWLIKNLLLYNSMSLINTRQTPLFCFATKPLSLDNNKSHRAPSSSLNFSFHKGIFSLPTNVNFIRCSRFNWIWQRTRRK